ncbi:MAG: 30S ribosomal protein S18 [Anaerolineales bacterium]|nr:30S ribosomal protein S18 [Anaerolineales bacterium]
MAFRRRRRRRGCRFCSGNADMIDYKNLDLLNDFVTARGKIAPRRKSHLCARHQRRVAQAVKRARQVALLPYTDEHIRLTG